MGKLKFGVSSIILGKEQKTENLKYDSVEWGEAATIRDFFRAGGNAGKIPRAPHPRGRYAQHLRAHDAFVAPRLQDVQ